MKNSSVRVIFVITVIVNLTYAARILGVFPTPSISHQIVYRALMKNLASRGHELVVVTPNPIRDSNNTNYTEIDISFTYEYWRERHNFAESKSLDVLSALFDTALNLCKMELNHPDVMKLISSDQNFDLIFAEWLIYPCICGFAYKFPSPMIGISSLGLFPSGHDSVGNPSNPAYLPDIFLPFTDHLNYFERVHSVYHFLKYQYKWYFQVLPQQDAIARNVFGDSMPYIGDIHNNVSMVFSSSHFVLHIPRPNVPALIEMGGIHVNERKPLPKDLQQYLDGAEQGAIYMSLGTNVMSSTLPPEKVENILDAFRKLPHLRILWKWEVEEINGRPNNVRLSKWLPQRDILAHPQVRLFITQGGLQSMEETIHCGVPMVGIPFFSDQDFNVNRGVATGTAVRLDLEDLTADTLVAAIQSVLSNSSYRDNIQKLSSLIRDQPETAMERAVWWTEYVLRHRGARHLRSAALDLHWYQYLLLDVLLGVLAVVFAVLLILILMIRSLYKWLLSIIRTTKFKGKKKQ